MASREENKLCTEQPAPSKAAQAVGDADTIDLVELFYRLLEKAKYIVAAALIGALLAGVYTIFCITPMYTATSKLYVLNPKDTAVNLSDLQIGTYLAEDYKEVFNIWHVHEMVIEELGLPYSYKQLSSMLTITNPSNTRILSITVKSPDPDEAKSIADTYAKVAREFIGTAMETEEPNVIEEALRPSSPSSPSKVKNVMLGFLLGLVVSCGLITLQFIMDDRIRNSEELSRYLGMTTLGILPMQGSRRNSREKRRKGDASA